MRQIAASGWFSRLALSAVVVFALLIGLDRPLDAQTTLIVSDYGSNSLSSFPINAAGIPGALTPVPGTAGAGLEGTACLYGGGTTEIFVAENGPSIYIYNLTTGVFNVTTPFATIAGAKFAALSLSPDGKTLYAADYNPSGGGIYAFDVQVGSPTYGMKIATTSPISGPFKDVAVDIGTGYVFGTDLFAFIPGHPATTTNNGGVYAFSPALPGVTLPGGPPQTLAPIPAANIPIIPIPASALSFGGLLFDANGNLWVSDYLSVTANDKHSPESMSTYAV
jgi:hypothetical protein